MKIDVLNSLEKSYGLNQNKNASKSSVNIEEEKKSEKTGKADSFELSDDAKKIQKIKTRVSSGVYEQKEVYDEVAKRLIQDSVI